MFKACTKDNAQTVLTSASARYGKTGLNAKLLTENLKERVWKFPPNIIHQCSLEHQLDYGLDYEKISFCLFVICWFEIGDVSTILIDQFKIKIFLA